MTSHTTPTMLFFPRYPLELSTVLKVLRQGLRTGAFHDSCLERSTVLKVLQQGRHILRVIGRSPFIYALPWAVQDSGHTAAERALRWLSDMVTKAPQLVTRPLSERCAVWKSLASMNGWMEKLIFQGYTLQFATPPPLSTEC